MAKTKHFADNIEFLEGVAEKLPPQKFDAVFSNYVLHWCKDEEVVIKQVAERLRAGGKFGFIASADFDATEVVFTPADMFSPTARKAMMDSFHVLDSKKLKELLIQNDFAIEFFNKFHRDWILEDIHEMIKFYRTHFITVGHEDFNIEVMKQHYGDGKIVITESKIIVVAIKK